MSRWVGRHSSAFETRIKSASISHSQVTGFGMKAWRHAPGHLLSRIRHSVTIANRAVPFVHVTAVRCMVKATRGLRALNASLYKLRRPILIDVVSVL